MVFQLAYFSSELVGSQSLENGDINKTTIMVQVLCREKNPTHVASSLAHVVFLEFQSL